MAKFKEDYKIIHPKNKEDGTEDRQFAIVTLGKRLGQTQFGKAENLMAAFMKIDGLDAIQPVGVYSVQLVIANTFDFNEVLSDVKALLDQAMSALIIPLKSGGQSVAT